MEGHMVEGSLLAHLVRVRMSQVVHLFRPQPKRLPQNTALVVRGGVLRGSIL